MTNNRILAVAVVIVVSWLASGFIGWTVCKSVENKEIRKMNDSMMSLVVEAEKTNVDHAIRTLEIALEGKDSEFIAESLEVAKRFSTETGGYGAERIQEIEGHIKK
jgi:ribosomal protein L17